MLLINKYNNLKMLSVVQVCVVLPVQNMEKTSHN